LQAGEAGKDKAQEDYDELLASMSVWRSVLHRAEVFLCPTLTACLAVVVLVVALAVVLVVAVIVVVVVAVVVVEVAGGRGKRGEGRRKEEE